MGRSAKAQDAIALSSRREQTAQFAHHSNERDEPRCQRYIEKSGRNESEKGETGGFGEDKRRAGLHP